MEDGMFSCHECKGWCLDQNPFGTDIELEWVVRVDDDIGCLEVSLMITG